MSLDDRVLETRGRFDPGGGVGFDGPVIKTNGSDNAQPTPSGGRIRKSKGPAQPAGADDRTRQVRGARQRQRILDAAVDLFATKGYRGTGVAALAERVGMTAPGLLYYFGSKERLLNEVVAERDRADALSSNGETQVGLTLASLRNLGRHNVETATLTRLYVVLGAESLDADDPLHDFFLDRYETARSLVRTLLQEAIDRGQIRKNIDVDQLAREVIAVSMGLEIQWLADPERIDLAGSIEAYVDRLIGELAPS